MTTARELYFSATIITLDGSDTNAYGEPCEPGQGYSEHSGHWDPDRSYWRVHEHRDDVRPDVYPPQCGVRPKQPVPAKSPTLLLGATKSVRSP
jgi:hypothetical protein